MVTSSVGADFFSVCARSRQPHKTRVVTSSSTRGCTTDPSGSCARHGPCGPVGRATAVRIISSSTACSWGFRPPCGREWPGWTRSRRRAGRVMDSGSDGDDGTDVRVFLVDDHAVVRAGLAAYLGTEPRMRVVGQAADGRAALQQLAVLAASGELPDVVLMDLLMPRMDGIATTAEIKQQWPEVEVVAVTSFVEEEQIRGALEAGAAGYLLKDADASDVADAVRAAVAGEVHLDPAAAKALTSALRAPRNEHSRLTPRER